jgi:hypothetical protein
MSRSAKSPANYFKTCFAVFADFFSTLSNEIVEKKLLKSA